MPEDKIQTEAIPEFTKFLFSDFYTAHKGGDPVDTAIAEEFIDSFTRRYINARLGRTKDIIFRSDLYYQLNKWQRYLFGGTDEYDHLREAAINMQTTTTETQTGESTTTENNETTDKLVREEVSSETGETTNTLNREGTTENHGKNTGTVKTEGTSDENTSGVVTSNGSSDGWDNSDVNTEDKTNSQLNENSSDNSSTSHNGSTLGVGSDYPQSEAEIPDDPSAEFNWKYASSAKKDKEVSSDTSDKTSAHESKTDETKTGKTETRNTSGAKTESTVNTTNDITGSTISTVTNDLSDDSTTTTNDVETGKTNTSKTGNVNGQDTRTVNGQGTTTGSTSGSRDITEDREGYTQLDRVLRILDYLHSHSYPPIYEVIEKLSVCFMAQFTDCEDEGYIDPSTDVLSKLKEA